MVNALKGWSGYDPADYRAYVHFKNEQQMDETELTARSREIAKEYQLEMPIMNLSYMKFYKQPVPNSESIFAVWGCGA